MESLFQNLNVKPLAEKVRPLTLNDYIGQKNIIGRDSYLRRMIEADIIPSMILYGPPGSGKTTLAKIIANMTNCKFISINAVSSGVTELRKIISEAKDALRFGQGRSIVFIDEIHRFNKGQQDILLPFIENGTIILIGATTENPFFEINSPLLSRAKIIRLEKLTENDLKDIIKRALTNANSDYGNLKIIIEDEALQAIVTYANGDARIALNVLEQAVAMCEAENKEITLEVLRLVIGNVVLKFDKKGDQHFDVVSAFIKSMRGSDADAAVHYLARLLESGEEVKFIARRIIICATEDVGNADPMALVIANSAAQAVHFVGLPEARIILAQAVCYIAKAPKSNSCYLAIDAAIHDLQTKNCGTVPEHLRDAHYAGVKEFGHGEGYLYPHDYPEGYVAQKYLPEQISDARYYKPKDIGAEKKYLDKA